MTISTTANRQDYTGDGCVKVFPYTFKTPATSDLDVFVAGTQKTLTTDYTVSGEGSATGGNVTFVTAPGCTLTVAIVRDVPYTQGTDYPENDPFPAASHEDALDKLTMLVQQIKELATRAIRFAAGSVTAAAGIIMPEAVANKYLRINSTCDGIDLVALTTCGTYADPITTAGDLLVGSATGLASRHAVGTNRYGFRVDTAQTDKLVWSADRATVFNVKDYGALGDASTNDTVAIQAAIDAARAVATGPAFGSLTRSAIVEFPIGAYVISHLDCTGAVGLELIGKAAWGVTLYASAQATTGKPVIDLTGSIGCRARGIIVSGYTPAGLDPAIISTVGWLIAASSAGDDSTAHVFETCGTEGKFSKGALYIFGGTNHVFIDCGFSQALKTKTTVFIGASNVESVTSLFKTINAGTPQTGEITFIAPEIHGANDATATGDVLRLYETYSIKIYGGVHDSSGDYHVLFNGTTNRNLLFSGVQFFSESGTPATDVFYTNNAAVQHLVVEACDFENAAFDYVAGALFNGTGASAQYPGLRVIGIPSNRLLGSYIYWAAEQDFVLADAAVNLAAGQTRYFGPGGGVATESNAEFRIHRPGLLVAMRAHVGGSPGAGETFTFTSRKNGGNCDLTTVISGTAVANADLTNRLVVATCDRIAVVAVASAGASTAGGVAVTLGFIPAD